MSDLSDYKRCVSGPLEASLRATIADLRAKLQACEAERDRLKTAVRLWDTALTYDGQQRKYRWNTRNLDRAFEATRQALKDNDHE